MERSLLRTACLSRDLSNAITDTGYIHNLSPQGEVVYREIQNFYNIDPKATKVDLELLREKLNKGKHADLLLSIISGIEEDTSLSPTNWQKELLESKIEDCKNRLANALLSPQTPLDEAMELVAELESLHQGNLGPEDAEEELLNDVDVGHILNEIDDSHKVSWAPAGFNDHLGGGTIRPCHAVIFALPDAGKTSFALAQLAHFTEQGYRVLYYGNEDAGQSILFRTLQAYTGASEKQVRRNPAKARDMAQKKGYNLAFFSFVESGSLAHIDKLVRKSKADILIVDQMRNLSVSHKENRVLELEAIAKGIREIAKKHQLLALSLTQAAESAANKLILEQGDVYYSNIGIQGTADLMIGLGVNEAYRKQGIRIASTPKNKISGHRDPFTFKMNEHTCQIGD